jgi:hypothetical protein
MASDPTALDLLACEVLKKALNQRVVIVRSKLVPSLRNRVWLVETDVRPVVLKRSLSGKSPTEFETLLLAKKAGLEVPFPLYMDHDYIVTEYIAGESCDRLINHMFSSKAAEGIGGWLGAFHESLESFGRPLVMADAVLPNFLQYDDKVFGVDLEDALPGEPLDDVGQVAASILGSEPFFTPIKFELCYRMLDGYESRTGMESVESVRPYVAKHLMLSVKAKPLYRRPFSQVASAIQKGWPNLA